MRPKRPGLGYRKERKRKPDARWGFMEDEEEVGDKLR
jgi:hypothetical protein